MKQKYVVSRNTEKKILTIREFSELSKDRFTLVCEESYGDDNIEKAIAEGKDALIKTLRTPNFYPVAVYIGKIADVVISLFEEKKGDVEPLELFCDDADLFTKEDAAEEAVTEEDVEIEDLLDTTEDKQDKQDASDLTVKPNVMDKTGSDKP